MHVFLCAVVELVGLTVYTTNECFQGFLFSEKAARSCFGITYEKRNILVPDYIFIYCNGVVPAQ